VLEHPLVQLTEKVATELPGTVTVAGTVKVKKEPFGMVFLVMIVN
jgi:hypothetical protein